MEFFFLKEFSFYFEKKRIKQSKFRVKNFNVLTIVACINVGDSNESKRSSLGEVFENDCMEYISLAV